MVAYYRETKVHNGSLIAKSCPTLATPWTVAHQAPLSMDFPDKNIAVDSISFSRGFSQPRTWTRVSCIAGKFFTNWAGKPKQKRLGLISKHVLFHIEKLYYEKVYASRNYEMHSQMC